MRSNWWSRWASYLSQHFVMSPLPHNWEKDCLAFEFCSNILNLYSFGYMCWKFGSNLFLFDLTYGRKKRGAFVFEHRIVSSVCLLCRHYSVRIISDYRPNASQLVECLFSANTYGDFYRLSCSCNWRIYTASLKRTEWCCYTTLWNA